MRKLKNKITCLLAVVLMVLIFPMTALADNSDTFYALGQDLSAEQKKTVLAEYGITEEQLSEYKVAYVTNEMEHQYLDSYIPSSVIGTRALSCVRVTKTAPGSGIRVTTKNISYCTISMYKNALVTSGVEDADVYVVAPSQISGTAALIGAWIAYEQMAEESISEDRKDVAMEEIVTIGELTDGTLESATNNDTGESVSAEVMEEVFSYVKARVVAEGLTDPEKIKDVLEDAQSDFNITFSEEQREKISGVMEDIGGLDIDPEKLIEQAGDLYDKYGDTILTGAKEVYSEVVTDEVKQNFWQLIGSIAKNIFNAIKKKAAN